MRMPTEKTTANNNDDISQNSCVPLSSLWSENTVCTGNDFHHDSIIWAEAPAYHDGAESNDTDPSRGLLLRNNNMEDLHSYLYRPYTSANVLNKHFQEVPMMSPASGHRPAVLRSVEVDVVTGRIRFEMEPQDSIDVPPPETPMSSLSSTQKSWLTVFVRQWARKKLAVPSKAASKCTCSPKVKKGVRRSVKAMKHVSIRSVSFLRNMSMKGKDRVVELNQNQDSGAPTKLKNIQQCSNTAACGVQQASMASASGLKEYDEEYDNMRKSKRSAKKGGKRIRNIWNGKPKREAGAAESTTLAEDKENQEI